MIYIDIYSTQAVIRSQEPLTVGLVGGQAHFRFSDRWKNLTKTVVFRQGDITKDVVGVTSGAVIPHEVLKVPGVPVEIGVYGSDATGKIIIPTVWVATDPVLEGADPMVDASTDPTLPVYQQIQAQVEKNTPLVVEIYGDSQTGYNSSRSYGEISHAHQSGRPVLARYGEILLPLVRLDGGGAYFTGMQPDWSVCTIVVRLNETQLEKWQGADDATVDALGKTVADHTTRIDGHTALINQHDTQIKVHVQTLEDQEADVAQLQTSMKGLQFQTDKQAGKISEHVGILYDHAVRLGKLEAGGGGSGGSGVHIGTEPPVDDGVSLWVNPEGGAESEDAAYHSETLVTDAASNDISLHFPCPLADFHELHIHMTGANAVSKLYMEAGEKSTFLIAPQHGTTSGTHIHLMATHERDTMNLDVTTAAYSENALPGVPLGTASIGNESTSLRLYSNDGGKDLLAGMEIRVWGVYKAEGIGALKIKNPETGAWENLKTLRGENGRDGNDGKDGENYVLTEADKQEIADLASEMIDVPSDGGKYRLIRKIVVDETNQANTFSISMDENGTPFEVEHLCVIAYIPASENKSDGYVDINSAAGYSIIFSINNADWFWCLQADKFGENVVMRGLGKASLSGIPSTANQGAVVAQLAGKIQSIRIRTASGAHKYPIGSTFEIYGY